MKPRQSVTVSSVLSAWGRILLGSSPLLSFEITRECPLSCPGCYAYSDGHLGDGKNLRHLADLHGDQLVDRVLQLVGCERPMQVSIVGGEPLIRHRELSKILPALSEMKVFTLVVTSLVIPFPAEWNAIPGVRITVSIDGLASEHDVRRKPATYATILKNLEGRRADISWVITNQMLERPGYLEEYLAFWTARPEIERIWMSLYTPQNGEVSAERLTPDSRRRVFEEIPRLKREYPALVFPDGALAAFASPPESPAHCTFTRISRNYSADLETRIEPCFFGGDPNCSECGCAVSAGLHWLHEKRLAPGLKAGHIIDASLAVGKLTTRP